MLRIAYVCEFLLALLAISVVWGQVGGQDHLDLMPWYDKFVLIFTLALVTVVGTIAAVSREEHAWNGITIACLIMAILILCAMGAVTYYYHVHEDQDQDTDNTAGVVYTGPLVPGRRQA
jgi:hypothetical protein